MAQTSLTKSIDVGSMFLMDLSVNESDPSSDLADTTRTDMDLSDATSTKNDHHHEYKRTTTPNAHNFNESKRAYLTLTTGIADHRTRATATIQQLDYLSSSLDRIASVIDCDGQQGEMTSNDEHSATIVEPQPLEYDQEPQSSYSLSDGSFVASSGTSLSASYTAGSELENEDRDSTTTREDSGVLDMKDLEDQLNNSYDNEGDKIHNHRLEQEKPISNIMATNLINKSKNGNHNHQQTTNYISKHSHRSGKPTEGSGSNHNHYHHGSRSKRSMSASVPIQVPVRQMRKDLNKMKLKLIKEEQAIDQNSRLFEYEGEQQNNLSREQQRDDKSSTRSFAWDDDDAFLEQEFNENHHNHYPVNEYDDERLRADQDPMKLFASIQALAKSLHNDAELFGSLPPKRLLESPIRSIALV